MEPLEKALALKKELDSLRPLNREQEQRIMQKFRLDWNFHSNNLEGNSLTYGETKALLLFGITAQGKPLKDHLEIEGHNEAIEWVIERVTGEYPLTESFIRELHQLLLKEPYWVNAITPEGAPTKKKIGLGQYKSLPNHVLTVTGEIFRFATPEETPARMDDLIQWYREKVSTESVNPILLAAEFHYRFIRIHPFDDGNGRTVRILMNFILMKYGFPPVIIKTQDKSNYLSALRQADSGIIEPFITYITSNLIHSLELMIRGAKGESIEEPDDFDKELALLERRLNQDTQEVEKTAELIHTLYDNSIVPLFHRFVEEGKKFDRFYVQPGYHITSNDYASPNISMAISAIRTKISQDTTEFGMSYYYKAFVNSDYGNFNHMASINVMLGPISYFMLLNHKPANLEKSYNEQLTEDEINNLVRMEMKRHKEFIEQKMAKK